MAAGRVGTEPRPARLPMGRMDPWSPCSPPLRPVRRSSRAGREWAYEVKWDGVRALADTTSGRLRLWSRNEREITAAYPELARAGAGAGRRARRRDRADGRRDPVVLGAGGAHARARPAPRGGARRAAPGDVPRLRRAPAGRRRRHADAPTTSAATRCRGSTCPTGCELSPVYPDGQELWEVTKQLGLEGVVAKRRSSRVRPGPTFTRLGQGTAPPHPRRARRRLARGDERLGPDGRGAVRCPRRRRRPALPRPGRQRADRAAGRGAAEAAGAAQRLPVRRRGARRSTPAAPAGASRPSSSTPCTSPATRPVGCASRSCGPSAPTPTPTRGSSRDARTPDGRRRGSPGPGEPPGEGHVPVDGDDQGRGDELPRPGGPGAAPPAARPAGDPDPVARRGGAARSSSRRTRRAAPRTGSAGRRCGRRPGAEDEGAELELPFLDDLAGLVWAANQGALELHTPQWRVGPRGKIHQPDRLVVDLDPGAPAGLDGVRGGGAPRRGPAARGRPRHDGARHVRQQGHAAVRAAAREPDGHGDPAVRARRRVRDRRRAPRRRWSRS